MDNKKQKIKRALIVGLCAVILSTVVISSYQDANESKAFVVADDIVFLAAVLGAYGIYLTYDWLNDGNNALDISDALEEEYNAERFRLIQGGGTDPDEEPPEWDDLSVTSLESNKLLMTTDVALCTLTAVTSLWDKLEKFGSKVADTVIPDLKADTDISLPLNGLQGMNGLDLGNVTVSRGYWLPPDSGYNAFLKRFDESGGLGLYYMTVYDPSNSGSSKYRGYFGGNYDSKHRTWICNSQSNFVSVHNFYKSGDKWISGGSVYDYIGDSYSDGNHSYVNLVSSIGGRVVIDPNSEILVGGDTIDEAVPYKKPVIWTTPELQDDFDTNGGLTPLEIPDNQQYPIELPSLDRLKDIDTALEPDADPDTGISPAPNYDPLRDFLDDIKPDPSPTPSPDPSPNPDPDNPSGSDDPAGNFDKGSLTADLSALFPFCIPFDLIHAIGVFNQEPEAPRLEWTLNIDSLDYSYTFVIDLDKFNSAAAICRTMFLIMFIIGLIISTRALIKG